MDNCGHTRWLYSEGFRIEGTTVPISDMLGGTVEDIVINYEGEGGDTIAFWMRDGTTFVMMHDQDCCETVLIKDIAGDIRGLIGEPLVMAEEATNRGETEDGTQTWTFYKFATNNGYVTISWHGESNGYYSESVDVVMLPPGKKKLPTRLSSNWSRGLVNPPLDE